MDYLKKNLEYWEKGYLAENVESFVFRGYGRILKADLGIDGSRHERLLDFGCGSGASLSFFSAKGFDVYGVDISAIDIDRCKARLPQICDHFKVIPPKPAAGQKYFDTNFQIVTAIQSLYYLSDTDTDVCIKALYDQMSVGGVIYATMIGTRADWFYNNSEPVADGLRRVNFSTPRIQVKDYFVNFTENEEHLIKKFRFFKKLHVGYYDSRYREDEGSDFHYIFVGRKE